jgi:tRNA pseudouridine55 synthase
MSDRAIDRGGVFVIDKPRGPTSHDVVAALRKRLRTREVGHAGTLDPMATGVLVVATGEATKLVPYLTAADKSYEATVVLGRATDTLDALGETVSESKVDEDVLLALTLYREGTVDLANQAALDLEAALEAERRRTLQVPPVFSALKIGGERAHALARRGEAPDLTARPVAVKKLELIAAGESPEPWLVVRLDVSKGYYVRALARDLASSLGTVGHLAALRRTRSGCFTLDEALLVDMPDGELEARRIPLDLAATRVLPRAELTDVGVRDVGFGRKIAAEGFREVPARGPHAWVDAAGQLLAIGELDEDGVGRVLRGFPLAREA